MARNELSTPFVYCLCSNSFHVLKTQIHMCNSIPHPWLMNTLIKIASNWRSSFQSLKFFLFTVTWRYHLYTCRQEFYFKWNWNSARIIMIGQQTKTLFIWKVQFGSFLIQWFTTINRNTFGTINIKPQPTVTIMPRII